MKFNKQYIRNGVIIYIFSILAAFVNYFFQIISNRNLTPEDFGTLNVVFSSIAIVSVLFTPLAQWFVKIFSEFIATNHFNKIKDILLKYYVFFITVSFLAILIILGLFKFDLIFIKKESAGVWSLAFIMILAMLALLPLTSFLTAFKKFFYQGLISFSNSLFVIIFLVIFIYTQFDLFTVLSIKVFAIFLSFFVALFFVVKSFSSEHVGVKNIKIKLENKTFFNFVLFALGTICLTVVMNVDMVIARVVFEPTVAGRFATVSVFGKVIYFFSTIFMPVFFSESNDLFFRGKETLSNLKSSVYLLIGIIIISFIAFLLLIKPFATFLRPEYLADVGSIKSFSYSMLIYPFIHLMTLYILSIERFKVFYFFMVLILLQVGFYFYFNTIQSYIYIRFFFGIVICVFLVIDIFIFKNKIK